MNFYLEKTTMLSLWRVAFASILLLTVIPCRAAAPNAREAGVWLQGRSLQLIRGAQAKMNDGTSAFLPQVGLNYNAFWLRDYAYMLEGCPEAFSDMELRNSLLTFVKALRSDGAGVDCVKCDGTPIYKPGYEGMGDNPVADGSQFTVDVAWRTQQRLKDAELLKRIIDPLVKSMNAVPRDSVTGLVYIDPSKAWDRCPYGFTDVVRKTGCELFCSLLDVRASRQLADLLEEVQRNTEAATWRIAADAKAAAIQKVFWDPNVGLFNAATIKCKQPDIWGSAFAVHLGIATAGQSHAIAQYFKRHHGEIVQKGQIRQLPVGVYWEGYDRKDYYQNGGFWGVASGWVVETLKLVDPALAEQTVVDMVRDYSQRGVWEWIHGEQVGVASYVACAALPLASLRKEYKLPKPVVIMETGGTFSPRRNLAAASARAHAFAKDVVSGDVKHTIDHLNDGVYGDAHSWQAGSNKSFAGIAFAEPTTFDTLAFGRDNTGVHTDYFAGIYTFQYTTVPNPTATTTESDWVSFGVVYLDARYPDAKGFLRHRFEFAPVANATGVRILVDGTGVAIDELEVLAMPQGVQP